MLKTIRTVLITMLALGTTLGVVSAQPADTDLAFTTAVGGVEVDLGTSGQASFNAADYRLREGASVSEEYVWFTNGTANFELVMIDGTNTTAESYTDVTLGNMEEFYEAWETTNEEVDGDTGTFSGVGEIGGSPVAVYYIYHHHMFDDVSVVFMSFSAVDGLEYDLEWAQENLTLNGENILADVDPAAEQALISGDSATGDDATAESGNTSGLRDRLTGQSSASETPEADDDTASPEVTGDGFESMGLVSDSEWVSPQYDTALTWDTATWAFPQDYDQALIINEERGYDVITLETTDGLGYVYVTIDTAADLTTDDMVAWWNSAEYADSWSNPIEIVDVRANETNAAVVIETTNARDQSLLVVINFEILEDGTGVWSQISSAPTTIGEVSQQYADGVQVNGEPIELVYTPEELQDLGE